MSHESGVPVSYSVSGKPFSFDQGTMHDVLMITREALHNSFRHGHPAHVKVRLHFSDSRCTVEIVDDGKGFDTTAQANGNNHYGLVGVRERGDRLGGILRIHSQVGGGTELSFQNLSEDKHG
jgi:signal transduction histidine kinase